MQTTEISSKEKGTTKENRQHTVEALLLPLPSVKGEELESRSIHLTFKSVSVSH